MRSFKIWFQNNGRTISSIGLIPLIVPTLLIVLSDLAHHGWIKSPLILVNFLFGLRGDNQQGFLFCAYSIGFTMVFLGEKAHCDKAAKNPTNLN